MKLGRGAGRGDDRAVTLGDEQGEGILGQSSLGVDTFRGDILGEDAADLKRLVLSCKEGLVRLSVLRCTVEEARAREGAEEKVLLAGVRGTVGTGETWVKGLTEGAPFDRFGVEDSGSSFEGTTSF